MVTAETYQIFYPCKKSISRSFEKFPFLVVPRNVIMSQHLIIQFPLYYLSSGHLWEVENKRKFQTFSSTSGCSRLREVPNIVTWFGNFWYFGKLIIEGEVVTHERVRHNRKSWTTYMYVWNVHCKLTFLFFCTFLIQASQCFFLLAISKDWSAMHTCGFMHKFIPFRYFCF